MSDWFHASGASVSLSSLLFMAESEAWTAEITLNPGSSLTVVQGQIVHARCGTFTGLDGLFELFITQLDSIDARSISLPANTTPLGDMARLTFDGVRRADEWNRLATSKFSLRGDMPSSISKNTSRLLRLLDSGSSLETVCSVGQVPRTWMADVVSSLVEEGVLGLEQPTARSGEPAREQPRELDYYECIDAGRDAYRAGRMPEAIAAFQRALDLRPGDRVASQNMRRVLNTQTGNAA